MKDINRKFSFIFYFNLHFSPFFSNNARRLEKQNEVVQKSHLFWLSSLILDVFLSYACLLLFLSLSA